MLTLDEQHNCSAASIAITGASVQTTRASTVEQALLGKTLDEKAIIAAALYASDGLEFVADIHGSQAYRRQMTIIFVKRALLHALART